MRHSGNGIRGVEDAIARQIQSDGYLGLPFLMTAVTQHGKPFRHSDDEGRVSKLISQTFHKKRERVEEFYETGNVAGRTVYSVITDGDWYEVEMRANGSKILAVRKMQ